MSTILDYKIITEQGSQALTDEVNKAIKEGWQPLGGHQIATVVDRVKGKGLILYSQSLVKFSV